MNRFFSLFLILALTSCGLIQMPFRVVGGVTKGTAQAVRKPIDTHKERKAKRKQAKAKEDAKAKRAEASKQQSEHLPESLFPPANDGSPDLQSLEPELPPLPSEYQDLPPIPQ